MCRCIVTEVYLLGRLHRTSALNTSPSRRTRTRVHMRGRAQTAAVPARTRTQAANAPDCISAGSRRVASERRTNDGRTKAQMQACTKPRQHGKPSRRREWRGQNLGETNCGSGSTTVAGWSALNRMIELRMCAVRSTRCGSARMYPFVKRSNMSPAVTTNLSETERATWALRCAECTFAWLERGRERHIGTGWRSGGEQLQAHHEEHGASTHCSPPLTSWSTSGAANFEVCMRSYAAHAHGKVRTKSRPLCAGVPSGAAHGWPSHSESASPRHRDAASGIADRAHPAP
jgi:hypothetical protein